MPACILYRDTNLLRIRLADPQVREELKRLLTYQKAVYKHQPRGRGRGGPKVQLVTTHCFETLPVEGEEQLVTPIGFLGRIEYLLQLRQIRHELHDLRPHPRPDLFTPQWEVLRDFELRPGQEEVLRTVAAHERGWIRWPTGTGKSWFIRLLCALYPRCRFHVATKHITVLQDRYRELAQLMPSVGISCSAEKKVLGQRVMCYSTGTLQKAEPNACEFLLVDEAHETGTDRMLEVFGRYRWARCFAFSANKIEDRMDGAGFELQGVFGQTIVNMEYNEGVDTGLIVPIEVRFSRVLMDHNPCHELTDDTARFRHGIWRNKVRNKMIAADARRHPDQQVLITVATLDHACQLKRLLPEFTLVYSATRDNQQTIDEYVARRKLADEPRLTPALMERYKLRFAENKLRKVIATTVWNRGVNFHQLEVICRADAVHSRANDTQIPGRLSRLGDGKQAGIVYDYLDEFDDGFWRRSELAVSNYRRLGYRVVLPPDYRSRRRTHDPRRKD